MKILQAPDRSTFEKLTYLLMKMSNLQRLKYRICLGFVEKNENIADYLNGREWDLIRTQFGHLQDFDCTIWTERISCNVNNISQQIIESFSQFSGWFVEVFQTNSNNSYICVYTKTRRLFHLDIDHDMLRNLNGHQIATLIDGASSIYMYTVRSCDGDKNAMEYSPLVLPDRIFSKLNSIKVGADCYMDFNKRLESFLKQLFSRTPNLTSIDISSHGSGDDYNDISDVLSCMEKPSKTIKNCRFSVKACYDESRMAEVIFYLPMLTSLRIEIIYSLEEFVDIVNTCFIHSKHLLYLELSLPWDLIYSKESDINNKNIQLWLKENTLLGDSVVGREFHAVIDHHVKIWL
ncbi:unnamed protein product [Rotaria sp. Silwood1]|nr:unnamed protein product [Rotaria sp. Silwood1]CAF1421065.1 unnamed protein product [Rotaria sp. Silwood1]CAF4951212.1 unnamed protein product [Rotaria sp. Silwood1]